MSIDKSQKYFRVKYGFTASDQVSIQDDELEKALYAQKFGEVVQLKGRQINGKYIISIAPHWHKYTGWYEFYEPSDGDDWKQIERDCSKDLDDIIRQKRERIDYLIHTGRKQLIGKNIEIPELDHKDIKVIEEKPGELKKITETLVDKFKIN